MPSRHAPSYGDQVARRIDFEQRHPEVSIERKVNRWEAAWIDTDDDGHTITVNVTSCAYPLERLLDKLDRAFGE